MKALLIILFCIVINICANAQVSVLNPILQDTSSLVKIGDKEYKYFKPQRVASWWCSVEDLLWPEQDVIDRIVKRADEMAAAKIECCVVFGFHMRFDYSNCFHALHGYLKTGADELHKRNIKFIDHYSCNLIERPRGNDFDKLHRYHRHHVLLHPDSLAAKHAQYENTFFQNICEVDIKDGGRGYSTAYMTELFCHNNPDFLGMHKKYLERLLREVPVDGMMVDDMAQYAGFRACSCDHCKEKFKEQFGHDLPPFEDKNFWGNTDLHEYQWGNYDNPVFRDWVRFKSLSVANHMKMVKETIGDMPLLTCVSAAGPVYLNALALNLERMEPYLDMALLENVGITVNSVNWMEKDAEAMLQLDVAKKLGNAPAFALSYTIYEDGAYLSWALSRYWGVTNWVSTLHGRLERDPKEKKDVPELVGRYNNWGIDNSIYDIYASKVNYELRIFNNLFNRENGWKDENGKEAWDYNKEWALACVKNNISYRFVRQQEICDAAELLKEKTPLIIDHCACVSEEQFAGIKEFLEKGGKVFVRLPFGIRDGNGYKRDKPLSDLLSAEQFKNLVFIENSGEEGLQHLIQNYSFNPRIKYIKGDKRFYSRLKIQNNQLVLHLLNGAMEGVAHPDDAQFGRKNILKEIVSKIKDTSYEIELDLKGLNIKNVNQFVLKSPELYAQHRSVEVINLGEDIYRIKFDLKDIRIYAVIE